MIKCRCVLLAAFLFPMFLVQGCALSKQLRTTSADQKTITGTYDLYMYGCRYPDDLEHAAFLIEPEKSPMVELFVRDTAVTIKRGLPADSALAEANKFVRCGNRTVEAIRFQRIPDGSGGTLGYEMLPRYPITDDGGMDPVLVNYSLKEGKIFVYIQLSPEAERTVNSQFSPAGGGP